jgi:hypothetical protein
MLGRSFNAEPARIKSGDTHPDLEPGYAPLRTSPDKNLRILATKFNPSPPQAARLELRDSQNEMRALNHERKNQGGVFFENGRKSSRAQVRHDPRYR